MFVWKQAKYSRKITARIIQEIEELYRRDKAAILQLFQIIEFTDVTRDKSKKIRNYEARFWTFTEMCSTVALRADPPARSRCLNIRRKIEDDY